MPAIIVRLLGKVAVDEVDDVAVAVVLVAPALLRRGDLLPCSTQHPSISLFAKTFRCARLPRCCNTLKLKRPRGGHGKSSPETVAYRVFGYGFQGFAR